MQLALRTRQRQYQMRSFDGGAEALGADRHLWRLRVYFQACVGPNSEVELIAGTTRDVTQCKKAEEVLARDQEEFERLVAGGGFENAYSACSCSRLGWPQVWFSAPPGRGVYPIPSVSRTIQLSHHARPELVGLCHSHEAPDVVH